jgi:hypothetical protein
MRRSGPDRVGARSGATMRIHFIATLSLSLALASCASDAPVEQIRVFNDAFTAADAAAQPLIDDLALAERQVGQVTAEARAKGEAPPAAAGATEGVGCPQTEVRWQDVGTGLGFIRGLCAADATYFASVGDPPGTRAYRGAMDVIRRYAEVLLMLAEGRNIDEVQAQVQTLAGNVSTLAAMVPGGQPFAAGIGPLVKQLEPVIAAAAQAQNDKEVRRLLNEGSPTVIALIDALRNGTGAIFLVLTDAAAERSLVEGDQNPALAKSNIAQI